MNTGQTDQTPVGRIVVRMGRDKGTFEVRISGDPPNGTAVLYRVNSDGTEELLANMGDILGLAQCFYEAELQHNFKMDRDSRAFKSRVKKVRKALGYSYP